MHLGQEVQELPLATADLDHSLALQAKALHDVLGKSTGAVLLLTALLAAFGLLRMVLARRE